MFPVLEELMKSAGHFIIPVNHEDEVWAERLPGILIARDRNISC